MGELAPLISAKFQYANYRKYVKEMTPPAIPFLGVYLTDLTFIEDGNQDFLPDSHLINFDKRMKVYSLISNNVQRFQQVPFALHPVTLIQDYIRKLSEPKCPEIMSYEALGDLSLEREPLILDSDEDDA
jgi:son of sevenless